MNAMYVYSSVYASSHTHFTRLLLSHSEN